MGTGLNPLMVRCVAHVLNLLAGSMYTALNSKLGELLVKIEKLAHFLKCSSKMRSDYLEHGKRILPPKNDTRWYSEFLVIEVFVEDYPKIMAFAADKHEMIKKKRSRTISITVIWNWKCLDS